MSENIELDNVLSICTRNGRISVQPHAWIHLHELLSHFDQNNADKLLAPLILSGWSYSADWEKSLRMKDHVSWANRNNCLLEVKNFLNELSEEDWYVERKNFS